LSIPKAYIGLLSLNKGTSCDLSKSSLSSSSSITPNSFPVGSFSISNSANLTSNSDSLALDFEFGEDVSSFFLLFDLGEDLLFSSRDL